MNRLVEPAPDWTLGFWRRTLIEGGGIDAVERSQTVYWAQTPYAFVDLRVPSVTAGPAVDPSAQDGFAGHISFAEDVCTWHRLIDLKPPGTADRARLRRVGNTLHEAGEGYREEFVLEAAGLSRCLGFATGDGKNILVVIDEVFLSAISQDHPGVVPEVSMGSLHPHLQIARSTVAARQNTPLFEDDPAVPDSGSFTARYRGSALVFQHLSARRHDAQPDARPFGIT